MKPVGNVLGTDEAHPLDFWIAVDPESYLQLDDIVAVKTDVPGREEITSYGVVDMVRSRHEGTKFDSDVFHSDVIPMNVATAAHVSVTRVEPEIFVPPQPGGQAFRATEDERDKALYFDAMENRFAAGLSREGDTIWGNLEFLDGTRGAHVNISGISGVATKTSYAMFLLYSLFHSDALGMHGANARAVIFNVKGEDLMFADKPNARLTADEEDRYGKLGLPSAPFADVGLWSPASKNAFEIVHSLGSRQDGVTAYCWSLREFCQGRLLRFLFAEADSETSQLSYAVSVVERYLYSETYGQPKDRTWIELEGNRITSFEDLVGYIRDNREVVFSRGNLAAGTQDAFLRRLEGSVDRVGHLIRRLDTTGDETAHQIQWGDSQLNVIDIHNLHDTAKRFVVGVVLRQLLDEKDQHGQRYPLVFVVLDELNKYAPRDGWSPIKEVVLDIAERGRSLGVILIGAQQTASEVERRVVANASFRIAGRLDAAEAERSEYGFLTQAARARASLLKPGRMFMHQPEIPVPLLLQFPFPAWATRPDEVAVTAEVPKGFTR
jgi:DNA helicase HerA-like ATPase